MSGRFPKRPTFVLFGIRIFLAISILFQFGQILEADGSGQVFNFSGDQSPTHPFEKKITSWGGYPRLSSKARNQGRVRIIVRVAVPYTPESLLVGQEGPLQRSAISEVQGRVLTDLARKGRSTVGTHAFKYTPHLSMTVDAETLNALLDSSDVDSIHEDIPVPPILNLSVPRIGAATMQASGITGSGVAVAILDTGVDKTHPFLTNSVVSEACYSTNDSYSGSSSLCPGGVTSSRATGSAMPYGGSCPAGECSHGTHVAGIAAGRSGIAGSPGPGVAPGAGIIAIQVFSRFDSDSYCGVGSSPCVMAWTSDIMNGLQRVYDLRGSFTIASSNLSLGGSAYSSNCDSEPEKPIIDTLRGAGIATVIASGNNGYCGYISAPACISSAISVGATDDVDQVASYSNSAPFMSLLAPGSSINSSVPGGGYQSWDGTSMATPHVTGAWALMKQSNPSATVTQILNAFSSTGLTVTDSKCTSVSKKRINVNQANNSLSGPPMVTTGSVTNVTTNSATLNGTVNANNLNTTVTFQYGLDTSYGLTVTADQSPVTGYTNTAMSKGLTGLITSTTYHYRVVATNGAGTSYGSDMTFTTLGSPAASTLISPSGIMSLTSPTYYWNAVSNADQYNLLVRDSTGTKVNQTYTAAQAGCASGTGVCSITPSAILSPGSGNWQIQTQNSWGLGPWSSVLNFNIINSTPKVDFNSDGKMDIFWRHKVRGDIALWYMDGVTLSNSIVIYQGVPLDWEIVGTGDFNNDGKTDILWRNVSTGQLYVWLMNNSTIISSGSPATISDPNWQIKGVGDFNGDGKADILWRHVLTGQVYVWLMNGATIASQGSPGTVDLNWEIKGVGDFDRDGKADILWQNNITGQVYIWLMDGTTIASQDSPGAVSDLNWEIKGVGDFNGDRKNDILWRHAISGQVFIWLMNGTTITSVGSPGAVSDLNWQIKGVGDFNGDGQADILWRHTATGQLYIWLMNGTNLVSMGSPGAVGDSSWTIVAP